MISRRGVLSGLAASSAGAATAAPRGPVVFIGDSITHFWKTSCPELFASGDWINRGVGGNTTAMMLERFERDALSFGPSVVHLLGGVNDFIRLSGPALVDDAAANLGAMVASARRAGAHVVLAKVLPTRRGIRVEFGREQLNRRIDGMAGPGVRVVDYGPSLLDFFGRLAKPYTLDGLHLSPAGYGKINPLAEREIAAARRAA